MFSWKLSNTHLSYHVDQVVELKRSADGRSQVVEQVALHELGDDEDGLAFGADRVEAHELVVAQFVHDEGLVQELLGAHATLSQGLDGHLGRLVPPAFVDLAEHAAAQKFNEGQGLARDLDYVLLGGHQCASDGLDLFARPRQLAAQSVLLN